MSNRSETRPLRCQLVTPGHSAKMIRKAAQSGCDGLVFDLEDAVAPSAKATARQTVYDALRSEAFGQSNVAVRVNAVNTPWFLDDMTALMHARLDAIVLPKVETPRDVHIADYFLGAGEVNHEVSLFLLIESGIGLENVRELIKSSARCAGVIFGAADFSASTGVAFNARGLHHARARLAAAASALGLQALDHVHPPIADDDGLRAQSLEARDIGFTGKWAIHPRQTDIIMAAFSPTLEEVEEARRVLDAYDTVIAEGKGAAAHAGALIDAASVKIMRRRLASIKAEREGT